MLHGNFTIGSNIIRMDMSHTDAQITTCVSFSKKV